MLGVGFGGAQRAPPNFEKGRHHVQHCRSEPDPSHVKAELTNGELTVVVPKAASAVAKKIPVSSGDRPKT